MNFTVKYRPLKCERDTPWTLAKPSEWAGNELVKRILTSLLKPGRKYIEDLALSLEWKVELKTAA